MRTSFVNLQTTLVENVVDMGIAPPAPLDPVTKVPRYVENAVAPAGYAYMQHDKAGPGWKLQAGALVAPPPIVING